MANIIQSLLKPSLLMILLFSWSTLSFSAAASKLNKQKQIVEKYLKGKTTFEKKAKMILSFKNWADKEVLSHSDKLSEEELTQIMQYSNLLKALNPAKLTIKNCKTSAENVLDEDLTPMSEKPSDQAQTILSWLKLICTKGK